MPAYVYTIPNSPTRSKSLPDLYPGDIEKFERPSSVASTEDLSSDSSFATAEKVRKFIESKFKDSKFGQSVVDIPRLRGLELDLGKQLGKGGLTSEVYEISGINLFELNVVKPSPRITGEGDAEASNDIENRQCIADRCSSQKHFDSRYALKRIRKDYSDNKDRLWMALCDLVVETRFLSSLDHPNIIKLRAISDEHPYSNKYFLVLDRLYDTLQTRIKTWQVQHRRNNCIGNRMLKRREKDKQELFQGRLVYAFDISNALSYLHSNNIIHRDIKPENIGFDIRGDVKIFDFGMAKELRKEDLIRRDGSYRNMSMMTGTMRYMAPENGLGQRYNAKCDVYSFAILLWEIMALQLPFANIKSHSQFVRKVFVGGTRPAVKKTWPKALQDIMHRGWSNAWQFRYTMKEVSGILQNELEQVGRRGGGEKDPPQPHRRGRSTSVLSPRKGGASLSVGRTILTSSATGCKSPSPSSRSSGQRLNDTSLRSSTHRLSDISLMSLDK